MSLAAFGDASLTFIADVCLAWLTNAVAQHAVVPFHAIIAEENPAALGYVLGVEEVDETHPLMVSPHTWEVERVGTGLAMAMGPLLRSARTVLFVDRFFDIREPRYKETLKACLDLLAAAGGHNVRCEIHVCDHPSRPPAEIIEREASRWLQGTLPGISVTLFVWKERRAGADFHARYLLTDVGGMNVESGFSAEGAHQQVQIGLLDFDLSQTKLNTFARNSLVFELVEPVLEIQSDGRVRRV